MNKDYPDRPTVKEESKALKVREEQETPEKAKEPGCLSDLLGEIFVYVVGIILIILLYPLFSAWQDRKDRSRNPTGHHHAQPRTLHPPRRRCMGQ
jgi:hypothetical protein